MQYVHFKQLDAKKSIWGTIVLEIVTCEPFICATSVCVWSRGSVVDQKWKRAPGAESLGCFIMWLRFKVKLYGFVFDLGGTHVPMTVKLEYIHLICPRQTSEASYTLHVNLRILHKDSGFFFVVVVVVVPHLLHWKRTKKWSLNGQYEQKEWLQQAKPVSCSYGSGGRSTQIL